MKSTRDFVNGLRSDESGITLVETLIATLILLFGLLAMAHLMSFGTIASKTLGRDATKSTAYAHDKMEELIGLDFADTTTNVTVNAPFTSDGVGLTAGGSIPPTAPASGYADYLDTDGARTTSSNAAYVRQWQIINDATGLKRIIVAVTSTRSLSYGAAPSAVLVTFKTS